MASKQIIAYGATVERSTDGVAWAAIPECKGIAIPAPSTDYIDATSLDSPNGFKEYIRGMRDAGEISLPCGYTAAGLPVGVQFQTAHFAEGKLLQIAAAYEKHANFTKRRPKL